MDFKSIKNSYGRVCGDICPRQTLRLMQNALRSLSFDVVFYTVTLVWGIVCLPFLLGPLRWTVTISRLWCGWTLWLLRHLVGLDFRVTGALPSPPFIIAAKHESAWETLALTYLTHNPAFILKSSLLHMPILGWYFQKLGMIPVRSTHPTQSLKHMLTCADHIKQQGRPMIIFPEGTRVHPGTTPPLKTGLWHLYQHLQVPIVPVSLDSGQFWGRRSWIKKPGNIHVHIHPPFFNPHITKTELLTHIKQAINGQEN